MRVSRNQDGVPFEVLIRGLHDEVSILIPIEVLVLQGWVEGGRRYHSSLWMLVCTREGQYSNLWRIQGGLNYEP